MAVKLLVNEDAEIDGVDVLLLPPPLLLLLDLLLLFELPQAATARPATSDTTTAKALPLSKCMYYLLLLLQLRTGSWGGRSAQPVRNCEQSLRARV
jgi:hypothetical protein